MHEAIKIIINNFFFVSAILSLKNIIIANAKKSIAIFVRALYEVNKKFN